MKDTATVRSNLPALIAAKVKERGGEEITIAEIVAETRLSTNTVRALMRGSGSRFDGHTVAVMCKYLGCNIEDLLKIVDPGQPSAGESDSTEH